MASIEKIYVDLPAEMVSAVRAAVDAGEYPSDGDAIRDALQDWADKRGLQCHTVNELQAKWQEAITEEHAGVSAHEVLDRLERKYQAMADAPNPTH